MLQADVRNTRGTQNNFELHGSEHVHQARTSYRTSIANFSFGERSGMLIFMTSFASDLFADKNTIVDMKNPDMHVETTAKYRMVPAKQETGSMGTGDPSDLEPRASLDLVPIPKISSRSCFDTKAQFLGP